MADSHFRTLIGFHIILTTPCLFHLFLVSLRATAVSHFVHTPLYIGCDKTLKRHPAAVAALLCEKVKLSREL